MIIKDLCTQKIIVYNLLKLFDRESKQVIIN